MGCYVVRGPVPRNRALILAILIILAILLQTIGIKVLTDLLCLLCRRSIDIQVLSDLPEFWVTPVGRESAPARAAACTTGSVWQGQEASDGVTFLA